MVSDDELRRRVKAARAYAGYDSTKDLAAAIGPHGKLGDRTLRTLEGAGAPRRFSDQHLVLIARACGLPLEFFEVDFARLPELAAGPTVDQRLAALEAEVFSEAADALARAVDGADAEGGKRHSTREETQP